MVKFNDIKNKLIEKKVRKTFKIGNHKVEVYNISIEQVAEVYEKIKSLYDQEKDVFTVESPETIAYIYETFTNLEIESGDDVLEALKQPNSKLKEIQREIVKSMSEVVRDFIKDKIAEIDEINIMMDTKELSSKAKELVKQYGIEINEENK